MQTEHDTIKPLNMKVYLKELSSRKPIDVIPPNQMLLYMYYHYQLFNVRLVNNTNADHF